MSSFRSRQRTNMRRDVKRHDDLTSPPSPGDKTDTTAPSARRPIVQKKPQVAPSADGPRKPYSGKRPGPGKPDWQKRQGENHSQSSGHTPPLKRKKTFETEQQDNNLAATERKPLAPPYARQTAQAEEDTLQRERPRMGQRDYQDRSSAKNYTRDRGPSGRKPLHTEDAPVKSARPSTRPAPDYPDDNTSPSAPRKLFSKPRHEATEPAASNEPPRRKPEETTRREFDSSPKRDTGPRKLFSQPQEQRTNRFRDEAPTQTKLSTESVSTPSAAPTPRKSFIKPASQSLKPLMEPSQRLETLRPAPVAVSPRPVRHTQTAEEPNVTSPREQDLQLFAPCPRGLENVLAQELAQLNTQQVEVLDGGVRFRGDYDTMMAANLHSRTASRVLLQVAQSAYRSEKDIYRLAMAVDWPRWFSVDKTIKVKTDGVAAQVKSLDYVSLTVKDAVCDCFRQAQPARPSVDTRHPDIRIQVFLTPDEVTLYLDTSGAPLFKRGWRQATGEAPLRENLAAGILLLAGYDGSQALIDPLCGSGTFLVEAADIALKRAPGRLRSFGFQQLLNYKPADWETLQQAAKQAEQAPHALNISGSDHDPDMIKLCQQNLQYAGLLEHITLDTQDILQVRPTATHGMLVSNPPYGVRLEELDQLASWYPTLGDWLKAHFAGWTAFLLSGDLRLDKLIRLSAKRRTPLFNGSLACRLFAIHMVAGSARKEKPSSSS